MKSSLHLPLTTICWLIACAQFSCKNESKPSPQSNDNLTVVFKQNNGHNPSEGGACRVIATGQSGTYTKDDDGKWWCKSKDGRTETECTGGRCADAKTASLPVDLVWNGTAIGVAVANQRYAPTTGGACKVVSGPNKGASGTYTQASDGTWWCKTSGSRETECSRGECEDARVITFPEGFQVGVEMVSNIVFVDDKKGAKHCITMVNKVTNEIIQTVCFPLEADRLKDLEKSPHDLDKKIAQNISQVVSKEK
jgi:hypothetical protein